jgi:hypothetical protein
MSLEALRNPEQGAGITSELSNGKKRKSADIQTQHPLDDEKTRVNWAETRADTHFGPGRPIVPSLPTNRDNVQVQGMLVNQPAFVLTGDTTGSMKRLIGASETEVASTDTHFLTARSLPLTDLTDGQSRWGTANNTIWFGARDQSNSPDASVKGAVVAGVALASRDEPHQFAANHPLDSPAIEHSEALPLAVKRKGTEEDDFSKNPRMVSAGPTVASEGAPEAIPMAIAPRIKGYVAKEIADPAATFSALPSSSGSSGTAAQLIQGFAETHSTIQGFRGEAVVSAGPHDQIVSETAFGATSLIERAGSGRGPVATATERSTPDVPFAGRPSGHPDTTSLESRTTASSIASAVFSPSHSEQFSLGNNQEANPRLNTSKQSSNESDEPKLHVAQRQDATIAQRQDDPIAQRRDTPSAQRQDAQQASLPGVTALKQPGTSITTPITANDEDSRRVKMASQNLTAQTSSGTTIISHDKAISSIASDIHNTSSIFTPHNDSAVASSDMQFVDVHNHSARNVENVAQSAKNFDETNRGITDHQTAVLLKPVSNEPNKSGTKDFSRENSVATTTLSASTIQRDQKNSPLDSAAGEARNISIADSRTLQPAHSLSGMAVDNPDFASHNKLNLALTNMPIDNASGQRSKQSTDELTKIIDASPNDDSVQLAQRLPSPAQLTKTSAESNAKDKSSPLDKVLANASQPLKGLSESNQHDDLAQPTKRLGSSPTQLVRTSAEPNEKNSDHSVPAQAQFDAHDQVASRIPLKSRPDFLARETTQPNVAHTDSTATVRALEHPNAVRELIPVKAELPTVVKAEPPAAGKAELPTAVKAELPTAFKAERSTAVKAERSTAIKAELPTADRKEPPQLEAQRSTAQAPVLARSSAHSDTTFVRTGSKGVVSARTEHPTIGTRDKEEQSKIDLPSPHEAPLDQSVHQRSERPDTTNAVSARQSGIAFATPNHLSNDNSLFSKTPARELTNSAKINLSSSAALLASNQPASRDLARTADVNQIAPTVPFTSKVAHEPDKPVLEGRISQSISVPNSGKPLVPNTQSNATASLKALPEINVPTKQRDVVVKQETQNPLAKPHEAIVRQNEPVQNPLAKSHDAIVRPDAPIQHSSTKAHEAIARPDAPVISPARLTEVHLPNNKLSESAQTSGSLNARMLVKNQKLEEHTGSKSPADSVRHGLPATEIVATKSYTASPTIPNKTESLAAKSAGMSSQLQLKSLVDLPKILTTHTLPLPAERGQTPSIPKTGPPGVPHVPEKTQTPTAQSRTGAQPISTADKVHSGSSSSRSKPQSTTSTNDSTPHRDPTSKPKQQPNTYVSNNIRHTEIPTTNVKFAEIKTSAGKHELPGTGLAVAAVIAAAGAAKIRTELKSGKPAETALVAPVKTATIYITRADVQAHAQTNVRTNEKNSVLIPGAKPTIQPNLHVVDQARHISPASKPAATPHLVIADKSHIINSGARSAAQQGSSETRRMPLPDTRPPGTGNISAKHELPGTEIAIAALIAATGAAKVRAEIRTGKPGEHGVLVTTSTFVGTTKANPQIRIVANDKIQITTTNPKTGAQTNPLAASQDRQPKPPSKNRSQPHIVANESRRTDPSSRTIAQPRVIATEKGHPVNPNTRSTVQQNVYDSNKTRLPEVTLSTRIPATKFVSEKRELPGAELAIAAMIAAAGAAKVRADTKSVKPAETPSLKPVVQTLGPSIKTTTPANKRSDKDTKLDTRLIAQSQPQTRNIIGQNQSISPNPHTNQQEQTSSINHKHNQQEQSGINHKHNQQEQSGVNHRHNQQEQISGINHRHNQPEKFSDANKLPQVKHTNNKHELPGTEIALAAIIAIAGAAKARGDAHVLTTPTANIQHLPIGQDVPTSASTERTPFQLNPDKTQICITELSTHTPLNSVANLPDEKLYSKDPVSGNHSQSFLQSTAHKLGPTMGSPLALPFSLPSLSITVLAADESNGSSSENIEETGGDSNADSNGQTASTAATIFTRPTYLISKNDTLVSIAEEMFHDANLAWLIADLNVGRMKDYRVDSKRIVEFRSRQQIHLPVWQDIVEFRRNRPKNTHPNNLITIVVETQVDRELLNSALKIVSPGAPASMTAKKPLPSIVPNIHGLLPAVKLT